MLAVARANLDHICCICFVDVRSLTPTEKVCDVKKDINMSKVLKLTAHITILKNPINQKYINDYCRKICETCFVKVQYSYNFREKIMASTATLKELLEGSDLNEEYIENLRYFCRICLNRQKNTKTTKCLSMKHLNWLKDCTGIRFTSLVDIDEFRIKEGTNINEIAVINDAHFPQQLCLNCFKKLQNVEEFRRSATQSFEYMISVIEGEIGPEDYLVAQEVKQTESALHKCAEFEMDNIYEKEQENFSTFNNMEEMINTTDYSNTLQTDNQTLEAVIEFMGDFSQYSDNCDEDFTFNFDNEFADCSNNDKNNCLRKTRTKKSKQCGINERKLKSIEKNIEAENAIKPKIEKKLKETDEMEHDDNIINSNPDKECSKMYSSKCTYNGHQGTEHKYDSTKIMYECLVCSKEFKRQSHLSDHIKAVHQKLRPFKCSYCSKTFSAKNSKRVHELQHTGDYPFVCNWCGKKFRRSNQLKTHLEIHTTNPELLCPICKRSQKSQNDLENHLKSHNDKRLQCPLCGKFFTRSSHLKDHHNAVHLKLRPFKCEICKSAFGDRKTRRMHEKTHTKDRPIKCRVCRSSFNTHSALTKHIHQFCHKTENTESGHKPKKKK